MSEINSKNARKWSLLGMRRVLGLMLNELISQDDSFTFVTADVARYFGTERFAESFPDHYIDVGIAEQNMLNVAAGIQKEGMNVLAATYSTFITARVLDQIRVSLGYMRLPVILVGVGAGLAEGDLSATHMGLEDVASIRSIPGIVIVEPADSVEFVKTLEATINHETPVYIRLTGRTGIPMIYKDDYDFKIGKAIQLCEGKDKFAFISAGVITSDVMNAAESIKNQYGIDFSVYDMHTIKPIDDELLADLESYEIIFVVEEHMRIGGLGSAICEYYADRVQRPRVVIVGVDDDYPKANDYEMLLDSCGLTTKGIVDTVIRYIKVDQLKGD